MAQELKALDCQGKINIDDEKVHSRNFAEWLVGVPNGASAMTTDDRISLHSQTIPAPSLGGGRFGSSAASKSEQLGIAYILASNLVHELKHWGAGHAHGTETTEAGMYGKRCPEGGMAGGPALSL